MRIHFKIRPFWPGHHEPNLLLLLRQYSTLPLTGIKILSQFGQGDSEYLFPYRLIEGHAMSFEVPFQGAGGEGVSSSSLRWWVVLWFVQNFVSRFHLEYNKNKMKWILFVRKVFVLNRVSVFQGSGGEGISSSSLRWWVVPWSVKSIVSIFHLDYNKHKMNWRLLVSKVFLSLTECPCSSSSSKLLTTICLKPAWLYIGFKSWNAKPGLKETCSWGLDGV